MNQFIIRNWMFQTSFISKKALNNTPESAWNWNALTINTSMSIIRALPDKPWNFKELSARKDFDINMVKEYPQKDWDYSELSKHRELSISILVATKDKPWNIEIVCHAVNNITTEDAIAHKHDFKWNWKYLTRKDIFPMMKEHSDCNWDWNKFSIEGIYSITDVLENPSLPWDWFYVTQHPDLTWDIVSKHMKLPWDWAEMSKREFITMDIVMKVNKPWSWCNFSQNPNVTPDMIRQYRMKPWCFFHLCHNSRFRESDDGSMLFEFPEEDWDWEHLSSFMTYNFMRDNLTRFPLSTHGILNGVGIDWSFVNETATLLPWNWVEVAGHPELTTEAAVMLLHHFHTDAAALDELTSRDELGWEIYEELERLGHILGWDEFHYHAYFNIDNLVKYKNKHWDWYEVSSSKKITMEDIEANMDLPWDWEGVSCNPNLTWQFIFKHPNLPWSYTHTFQKAMNQKAEHDMEKARILSRTIVLKEDVIAKALHPERFEKYLTTYHYDMAGDEYI